MLFTIETSFTVSFEEKMNSETLVASNIAEGKILPERLKMFRKSIVSSGLHNFF